jgi:type I restriction enzyme S subunit
MKKYGAYKDSGIEWIGEIPEHWDRVRLKTIVSKKITDGPHETPVWVNKGIPFISAEAIKGNRIDLNFKRGFISLEQHLEYCKKSKVKKDDILFCKSGSTTGKSALVDTEEDFGIWSPLAIIRTNKEKANYNFVFQSIQANYFRLQVETSWTFGTQPNIGMSSLENLWIAKPPLEEQTQIANYLDQKNQQIDDLIAKKERLIKLLEEERTALINQAVTKGLDPNAPMKESGIDWLGEIPEHWELKKLKFILTSKNSERIPLSSEERGKMKVKTFDYYGASGVIDKVEDYLFDEEHILLGEDGANLVTRTKRLAFIARGKYWVNNHAHILKPLKGNINYLCELLELIDYSIWISGSAQPKLTQESLLSINMFEPPVNEQNVIMTFLDEKTTQIDATLKKIQSEIELLKEYKTALINEVVTGKIDVRDEELIY